MMARGGGSGHRIATLLVLGRRIGPPIQQHGNARRRAGLCGSQQRRGAVSRPSVDLGFGSSQFTLIGNGDIQYSFRNLWSRAVPYAGAGVAFAWTKYQDAPSGADDSDGSIGLNLYLGAERGFGDYNSGYVEIRIGIDEIPDFKLMIGYGFY